jgi:hypothetical protein
MSEGLEALDKSVNRKIEELKVVRVRSELTGIFEFAKAMKNSFAIVIHVSA